MKWANVHGRSQNDAWPVENEKERWSRLVLLSCCGLTRWQNNFPRLHRPWLLTQFLYLLTRDAQIFPVFGALEWDQENSQVSFFLLIFKSQPELSFRGDPLGWVLVWQLQIWTRSKTWPPMIRSPRGLMWLVDYMDRTTVNGWFTLSQFWSGQDWSERRQENFIPQVPIPYVQPSSVFVTTAIASTTFSASGCWRSLHLKPGAEPHGFSTKGASAREFLFPPSLTPMGRIGWLSLWRDLFCLR